MEKNQIWTIVLVSLVVAIVSSLVVSSLKTANLAPVYGSGVSVYTTSEIDTKLGALKETCQYIHYKDPIYNNYSFGNMSLTNVCQNVSKGFVPKIIVETESSYLYNGKDCSPSYQIYEKIGDNLINYKTELAGVKIRQSALNACNNAVFPDGSSNGNFSTEIHRLYSGVLCCRN